MSILPKRYSIEDFFSKPQTVQFTISTNGTHIAWLAPWTTPTNETRLNVFARAISSEEVIQLTFEKDRDIASISWGNDSIVLYGKDEGGDENFHLYAVSLDGKPARCLTPYQGVKVQFQDILEHDNEHVNISMNKENSEVFDVYKLNIITGEHTMIAKNPGNIIAWQSDNSGTVRIGLTSDGVNRTLLYRSADELEFRPLFTTTFRDTFFGLQFAQDNIHFYATSNLNRDTKAIVLYNPETQEEVDVIYHNEDYDTDDISYSSYRAVLKYILYSSSKVHRVFFDETSRQLFERLEKHFPGYSLRIADSSFNEEILIVMVYSDKNPGRYYLYNTLNDSHEFLSAIKPELNDEDMAEMKPIQYASRDGLTINGYLTLPVGIEHSNMPVIINPHGGPWVRDEWRFNSLVQFLANRGYAVLQMNYRGSTGYGREFWMKSFKQWGRAMQDDISDGVRWLVENGIADPSNVAILGGSYGGYATLAGLTFTPELYKCGVDIVGVSNLFSFRESFPAYWQPLQEMTDAMIGNVVSDKDMLMEVSPIFHVERITAPLLVFQGANDPRVNINESNQIVEALRLRGIDVEYIVKDNEGHGFNNQENVLEMYSIIEQFFAKHLNP